MNNCKKQKRIAIIGTAGIPARYGGFETLAENLAIELQHDFQITVFCSSLIYTEKPKKAGKVKLVYLPFKPNGWGSVPYDIISLIYAVFKNDTILILGASGCIILPVLKLFFRKKIIFNVDGLERERITYKSASKYFSVYSERIAIKYADVLVSDNEAVSFLIKEYFKKESTFIPYGGNHTFKVLPEVTDVKKYSFLKEKYVCVVSRIVPDNSVEIILQAFAEIKELILVFIGNWDNSNFGGDLFEKYHNKKNICLLQAIYDKRELNLIRSNSYFYINGHAAGGTPPSLAEAMFLGLPVIAYKSKSNISATNEQALYFNSSVSLIEVINSLDTEKLNELSVKMLSIAKEKYNWDIIANQYSELF